MKHHIANWIFDNLSGNPDEYCTPPGSEVWKEFGEMDGKRPMYTATTYNNHGFELWITYTAGGPWLIHLWAKEARELAWIILWDWWIKSTWCGLKRRIWYWALSAKNRREGIGVRG